MWDAIWPRDLHSNVHLRIEFCKPIFTCKTGASAPRLTLQDFHRNGGSAKLSEPRRRASGAGLGAAGAFRASWDNSFSTYVIALGPKSRTHREILSVSLSRRKVLELPLQFTANDCAQVRAPTSAAAEPSHAAPPNSCPRPEFTPLCALSSRTGPAGVLLFYIGIPGRLSRPQRPHQQALEWRVAYGGR